MWARELARFADASFYQTTAYGFINWGEAQLHHWRMPGSEGPDAIAQVRVIELPVLGGGIAYVRWGPCVQPRGCSWDVNRFRRALASLVQEFARKRKLLVRVIPNIFTNEPHAAEAAQALEDHGFQRDLSMPPYRTMRVDLTPDASVIRQRLHQKWRNQLNGAERNGLKVLEGTDDHLYAAFLRIYDEMLARKQFDSSVDPRMFRQIQSILPSDQKMLIALCLKDENPLCAVVTTPVGNAGIYLLGATSNDGMKSKGSYLLHWSMMNRLRERGCKWYDLGGVNPQANPGVYHFKQGMGGEECLQLGTYSHSGGSLSSLLVTLADNFRNRRSKLRSPAATKPLSSQMQTES